MKLYYSIKEVSQMLNVNPSLLRFWESEFKQLRPHKNAGGTRCYTDKDIALIRKIYQLTKEEGYTLEGVRQQLKKRHLSELYSNDPTPSPVVETKTIDPNTQTSLFDIDSSNPDTERLQQLETQLQESQKLNHKLNDQLSSQRSSRQQALESLRQARQQLESFRQSLHQ